jgi:hypothetical protein
MQKAIIGTAVGVLGLGGLVIASSGRTTPIDSSAQTAVTGSERAGSTIVDCGEGRQALVHPQASGGSRVECVPTAVAQPQAIGMPYATQYAGGPTQFAPAAPIVQERVVYRERPVARTTARRATPATYSQPAPVYREPQRQTRSWKKSAVIIGGSTAGGAGVGAVLGGKSGAKKGAVVGLVGGTVYDIATRNK